MLIQHPDSVLAFAIPFCDQFDKKSEMFKYAVDYITNTFAKSNIMGMDKVYVYMVNRYYCQFDEKGNSVAYWMKDKEKLTELCDENKVRMNLVQGVRPPNISLRDTTDVNWKDFYSLKSEYTILYFWDPECGHCKKTTPKLQTLYEKKFKARNVEIFSVGKATGDDFEKWKKFIKLGIDDWQVAFENAGWKNAIRGEYWPENDPTMSLEDARFSVLRYFAAEIQNAYGPNVHDPRTGEILESHIGWYHNIMSLLRNWYLIQTAAVDPAARKKQFDDNLMGELIRFVSSHEVGHTLGLRHNMGASSATPVEKLRDAAFQEKNGHTSSIMDYARFNYVAQPEDGVKHLFPKIGDYDKWAIKWGYSYFEDAKTDKEEKAILNEMTKEAYKNRRLWFGTESSPYDPRYQTEDIGDNAMKASAYGIKNLQRILPNLLKWSSEKGESYAELDELYSALTGQFRRYLGHVTKNVGGIYDTPKTYDMGGNQFEVVPRSIQKEAVSFLNTQLFATPKWLMNQSVLAKINPDNGVEAIKAMQESTLSNLLAGDRMVRLFEGSSINKNNYTVDELMTDVRNGIFAELKSNKPIDIYRRNLQKVFVDKVTGLLKPGSTAVRSVPVGVTYGFNTRTVNLNQTDLPSIARGQLVSLKSNAKAAAARATDRLSKLHLLDLVARIDTALDPK